MAVVGDLVAARKAAIERGDKSLGREIYHQLLSMGVDAETIDAPVVEPVAVAVEGPTPELEVEKPKPRRAVKEPSEKRGE